MWDLAGGGDFIYGPFSKNWELPTLGCSKYSLNRAVQQSSYSMAQATVFSACLRAVTSTHIKKSENRWKYLIKKLGKKFQKLAHS